ncbi:alpha/beta hydrolase family protein [Winogradskyella wandonensis]|uniref:Alpha/beta hydrolase family protein n=1 Tax=Winogradskyella wandonensis TaxID=1442586 RepID=A0A4R1KTX4_9FLAO|nr:alpha/beta hydrolase [Winogradskyella wandonensis]TCK68632.1 alpha/beta hydrolase family protein [Winogradskyella wandonensis]
MSSFVIKSIGNALNATSYISPKYASNKALQLFATPRKGSYTDAQKAIIEDAEQSSFSYKNLSISVYNWKGKGKTLLLAHGWESNAARWNYLLNDLKSQDYNIVALDAPAHGNSEGKQFNAVLYSEFINVVAKAFQPEVFIGHSVGGMASIFCLHNHDLPSVKKLITLGAPAHFTGVFSRYKQMMGYNKRISNGLDNIVLERFGQKTDYFSAANFTKNFEVEGLIIHDKKDKIIPYEDALLFANRYKKGELLTTVGFGHGLKDKSITPKLIEFINR